MRTALQMESYIQANSGKKFSVSLWINGHDVWIHSKHLCRYGTYRLRGRFWQGETRHWRDQTPEFEAWVKAGCKGKFFPRGNEKEVLHVEVAH